MEKSIEVIWKEGFLKNTDLSTPKLNNLYNKKSKHITDDLIKKMKREMWLLVLISIVPIFVNVLLGNEFIWGVISFVVSIPWYFIAKKNYREIKKIDYSENCYSYLKAIHNKLKKVTSFYQKLSVYSVPIILLPMLIYTYFNNQDKTFGEIVGNTELGGSNLLIFFFIPIMTLFAYVFFKIVLKTGSSIGKKINSLLLDMEELRTA